MKMLLFKLLYWDIDNIKNAKSASSMEINEQTSAKCVFFLAIVITLGAITCNIINSPLLIGLTVNIALLCLLVFYILFMFCVFR